jgi:hypothetical protein
MPAMFSFAVLFQGGIKLQHFRFDEDDAIVN